MNNIDILIKSKDLLDIDKFKLFLRTLYLKEKETYLHSIRVSRYSRELAIELGLSKKEIEQIWLAGLMHDMGKLLVPNYILLGTTQLTDDELNIIRRHPVDGALLIQDVVSEKILAGSLEHHERLDGKGYPFGIKNISLIGKIIAITDTFDAMTSKRTYQEAMPFKECITRMEELSNYHLYDKNILMKFKNVVERLS